jgi:cytochrome c553
MTFRHSPGLVLALLCCSAVRAADPDPKGVEFFEAKIRPVLVEHCVKCHSSDAEKNNKLKAELYLDTAEGVKKGGESGKVVVPHKAAESLLLKSLKYDGDVKMPPKGKLPDAVISDFEKWVNMGAPDPRGGKVAARRQVGMSVEDGRKFWAYQLPKAPAAPAVTNADWAKADIDRFILSKLEEKRFAPAKPADRATLARRLYYDLIGLPPTPEEVDAFVKDPSGDAVEKLVDKLLASPHFGERWGRHWLDVARYAESVTLRGFVLDEAWRYRDYVIESFNNDVPFDRFVKEQIAGDLLPADDWAAKRRQTTATTFLALGNTNLEEQDKKQLRMDVVDEQLDVITKGFLAQTVTCARCHDHKFDPIPTKDYYALAGILRNAKTLEHANVSKWIDVPLPVDPADETVLKTAEDAIAALQARIKAEKGKTSVAKAGGILPVKDVPGVVVDDAAAKKVGDWMHSTHSGQYIAAGYLHDMNAGKGEKTLTFQPDNLPPGKYEVRLAYSPGTSRAENVPVAVFSADGEKELTVDMRKNPPVDDRFVSLGEHRFEKGGLAYVIISNENTKGHVTADAIAFVPVEKTESGATKAVGKAGTSDTLKAMEAELKKLQEVSPKRPKAISVVEEKQIEGARVHVRGSVHNLGDAAPRGVLQVALHGPAPTFPKGQSGRRELAEWITSKDNPLTARVIVNRTWHWLFGSGLVRTTDNFGTTGELPSHPELLDHLATKFVADGWSMKKLVRSIVLSRTYQQSTVGDAKLLAVDPDNRLFGRFNRRRQDAEVLRDTILSVSGQLSPEREGPTYPATLAADYSYKTTSTRRSVYLPMFRNAMPELLEVFDMADPSTVTGARNVSTVAPQALYLMNNPFVAEQAKAAAQRLLDGSRNMNDDQRLTRLYRLTLGREPTAGEREVATKFLQNRSDASDAWAKLFHAVFASADFRYVN